jgi:hypothetical protein
MFTSTFSQSSKKAKNLYEQEDSAMQIDTSLNYNYDKSISRTIKYSGIDCIDGQLSAMGKNYDHRPI